VPSSVLYYQSPSGRTPVIEFLDGLTFVKERAAVVADISLLADEGPILPFPWTSDLRSYPGLRELRTRFGGAQFRIIYTIRHGEVILLHAFKKTSSAQVQRDYKVAAQRARSLR
jgi:phage-related protein